MVTAVVVPDVPRDYTLFRFDVDEDTVRWLLSSLPGVTPLEAEARRADDADADGPSRDETRVADDGADAGTTDDASGVANGERRGTPGSEAHLDDASSGGDRVSTRLGVIPSTPWPGAPTDEGEAADGLLKRLRGRKVLLAVGLVLGLGVIGAVLFLKKRGTDESGGEPGDERWSGARPNDPEVAKARPDTEHPPAGMSTDEVGAHTYPIDVSPLVGIGFLAVVATAIRRFYLSDES